MNKRVDALIEKARQLSSDERDELLLRLHLECDGSDDGSTAEEIDAAWQSELDERIVKAERGETVAMPHETIMAELRKLVRRT